MFQDFIKWLKCLIFQGFRAYGSMSEVILKCLKNALKSRVFMNVEFVFGCVGSIQKLRVWKMA